MNAELLLERNRNEIEGLCRKYQVRRLRLFGSALGAEWKANDSDFDFLAEFDAPRDMNAFDQLMGFAIEMKTLLGHNVDVVDWNAAKNPFFKRFAEQQAREVFAT